jgi:hypothetical protein
MVKTSSPGGASGKTPFLWLPVTDGSSMDGTRGITAHGDYPIATLGSATADGAIRFGSVIPTDFGALTKAVVLVESAESANLRHTITTDFGAVGETHDTHSDGITIATLAVTANELVEVNVILAFTGIAEGDYFGLLYTRNGSDGADTITTLRCYGLRIEGTA